MLNNSIKLVNPLVFLDLASTDIDLKKARIVRISTIKILPDNTKIFVTNIINPEDEISKDAEKIHRISQEMVEKEKPFHKYSESISKHLAGCD